ncbi:unnamed protein product [Calicophoron daubneyi]
MSSTDKPSSLHLELEEFLAEVDAISNYEATDSPSVSASKYVITRGPIIRKAVSGDQECGASQSKNLEEFKCRTPKKSPKTERTRKRKSNKSLASKRKRSVSDDAGDKENNCLRQFIGCSDSSGADDDDTGSIISERPSTTRTKQQKTSKKEKSRSGSNVEEREDFIGPRLPSSIRCKVEVEIEEDSASQHASGPSIGPVPCPVAGAVTVNSRLGSPPDTRKVQKSKKLRTEAAVQRAFEKFDSFGVTLPDISTLHILYIQLFTRFEDWKCGKLSSKYFMKKLNEVDTQLTGLAGYGLPSHWACHWSSERKRYFYENSSTGCIQWEFPHKNGKNASPETVCAEEEPMSGTDVSSPPASHHDTDVALLLVDYGTPSHESQSPPTSPGRSKQLTCPSPPSPPPLLAVVRTSDRGSDTENSGEYQSPTKPDLDAQLREFELACLEFENTGSVGENSETNESQEASPADYNLRLPKKSTLTSSAVNGNSSKVFHSKAKA